MKRVTLSVFVLVSFLLYSFGIRSIDSSSLPGPNNVPAVRNEESESDDSTVVRPNTPSIGSNTSQKQGNYRDGTYKGSVADAFYGTIQVQAVIKGGRITDVKFLQYPNDQPNSVAINQQAMPYLRQEAIKAQDSQVDGVSGATDTSQAFVQSLSVALRQAR